jgi:SAM-dependent methyltransferase
LLSDKDFPWISTNPFLENLTKYKFASKFVNGSVLDYNHISSVAFTASEILLDSNASQVFHFNVDNNLYEIREIKDNSIDFSIKRDFNFEPNTFDGIISLDTILFVDHIKLLSLFKKILKPNGIGILSIPNFNYLKKNELSNNTKINYSKDDFISELSKYFHVDLYLQILRPSKISQEKQFKNDFKLKFIKLLRPINIIPHSKILTFIFERFFKQKYVSISNYEFSQNQISYDIIKNNPENFDVVNYVAVIKKK